EYQGAMGDAPLALPLLEPIDIAGGRKLAHADAVGRDTFRGGAKALEHQDVALYQRAVGRQELDHDVGEEVHGMVLMRMHALDHKQQLAGRAVEEAVKIDCVVMIGRPRQRPVLPIDPADESFERVLYGEAGLELVEEAVEIAAG